MKILSLNALPSKEDLLNSVFVYPTDTCYGIGCNALDEYLVQRINNIKGREYTKPLSIMVPDKEMFAQYGEMSEIVEQLIHNCLPGDVTIVAPKTANVPHFIAPENKHIGIRIPNYFFCNTLMEIMGVPIIATSANRTGDHSPYSIEEVLHSLENANDLPDYVFDGGVLHEVPPSTILKVDGSDVEILRQGRVIV